MRWQFHHGSWKGDPFSDSITSLCRGGNWQAWSLATRVGFIQSLDSRPIPWSDRFQLGGPTDVRMFRMNGIGPKDYGESLLLEWEAKSDFCQIFLLRTSKAVFTLFPEQVTLLEETHSGPLGLVFSLQFLTRNIGLWRFILSLMLGNWLNLIRVSESVHIFLL